MKKSFLIIGLALAMFSCNKEGATTASENKTAYVDTSKLIEENQEAKDIESKYKTKSQEMGRELEGEAKQFQSDAANFQRDAQVKGMAWAQQKGAELQKREQQINMKRQAMLQTLQQESGKEMDSLVKRIKDYIKDYGKKNNYEYIYGTGDAATILYGKEGLDITEKISKELNDKYKSSDKKEEKTEEKK